MITINGIQVHAILSRNFSETNQIAIPEDTRTRMGVYARDSVNAGGASYEVRNAFIADIRQAESLGFPQDRIVFLSAAPRNVTLVDMTVAPRRAATPRNTAGQPSVPAVAPARVSPPARPQTTPAPPVAPEVTLPEVPRVMIGNIPMVLCASETMTRLDRVRIPADARTALGVEVGGTIVVGGTELRVNRAGMDDIALYSNSVEQTEMIFVHPRQTFIPSSEVYSLLEPEVVVRLTPEQIRDRVQTELQTLAGADIAVDLETEVSEVDGDVLVKIKYLPGVDGEARGATWEEAFRNAKAQLRTRTQDLVNRSNTLRTRIA